MRLTHLKLAGFKSFVDATTINLHGQRVGVVGPNGCGKSNVMESVRWVLGESSAKEMRADAMDAVIFNGSSNRKPISRASVELIFDNSLGSAAGEWSKYAEISVKRVIEREKGSTYYINNSAVRRRDVADLFLGTGLGGRAYAIIGQNTISRIVEAKPEELRIFLEEAAGISKYKERRRETELRLRDTCENLVRVEDICRELQKQIVKLASQAIVTQQYHALQAAFKLADGQFWLLKKRDASRDWEKTKAIVEKLVNTLEAQMASLRKSESVLETSRQLHYAASESINKAQAAYYEANAEVSKLENQVKQTLEARERMTLQLTQLRQSLERSASTSAVLHADLAQQQVELTSATDYELQAQLTLDGLKQTLPQKEALLKATSESAQKSQQALSETNQRIALENSNIHYLNQTVIENKQRLQRFESDLSHLSLPDLTLIKTRETALKAAQQDIAAIESVLQKLRTDETCLQVETNAMREALNQAQRENNAAESEVRSLQKMQQSLNSTGKVADWLTSRGLETSARLWQQIKIDETWGVALEAVLGAKLNALISNKATHKNDLGNRPPGALVMGFRASVDSTNAVKNAHLTPLISIIKDCDADLRPILEDWLAGTYVLDTNVLETNVLDTNFLDTKSFDTSDVAQHHINKLALGETLVNQQGDVFSRHSVAYHCENSSLHGVLERQHQLEQLQKNQPALQQQLQKISAALIKAETKLQAARQQQQLENSQLRLTTSALHQLQLELSSLQQAQQVAIERKKNINADMEVISVKLTQLASDISHKNSNLQTINMQLNALEAAKNTNLATKLDAEQVYLASRDTMQSAEKKLQEAFFNKKILVNIINDLNSKINVNNDEKTVFLKRQTDAEDSLKLTPMETLKFNLTAAIDVKQLRESALSQARNHLAGQEQILHDQERMRMQNEQQLHPMRDSVEQSRLNEQAARLHFEQCQAGLLENGINEQTLAKDLAGNEKASDFARKTSQLQQQISDLGAVNLAAIQELATETERKTYLDSQMLDLRLATETLEDAIKKIDRETREKLMHTYNTVNGHFNELFATLFGGGQARLELLGDEILDTGLQVFAQPPGKKNTTIQLLSGGEKALTAIALVFALFRLNPAPFCLMDEVDAPLDDSNTERFCNMVKKMSERTQFLFVSHNKITMEMAQQLIGVTMQESGVSRIVDVDIEAALNMQV